MNFEYNPVSKPSYRRRKPTSKMRGRITPDVYQTALERSGGRCERCNKTGYLEAAHLVRRWKIEGSTTANDIAMLCGPAVNTGTCHNWVDYTAEGRAWAEEYRQQLYKKAHE
ncbi:HNH endonuclease [Paenibacillus sp. 79R4]|uniref:HNH endonuclease n=1 Tax=Paenibacillus sp. 79R4 TaxID=2212847 RepID=UPI0015C0B52A|nr:HNH endonuclease [Paenibacillus sp. 79R4]NWL87586.1 HNH endonuclease [Paenibacillus sp. 79R4]